MGPEHVHVHDASSSSHTPMAVIPGEKEACLMHTIN